MYLYVYDMSQGCDVNGRLCYCFSVVLNVALFICICIYNYFVSFCSMLKKLCYVNVYMYVCLYILRIDIVYTSNVIIYILLILFYLGTT